MPVTNEIQILSSIEKHNACTEKKTYNRYWVKRFHGRHFKNTY